MNKDTNNRSISLKLLLLHTVFAHIDTIKWAYSNFLLIPCFSKCPLCMRSKNFDCLIDCLCMDQADQQNNRNDFNYHQYNHLNSRKSAGKISIRPILPEQMHLYFHFITFLIFSLFLLITDTIKQFFVFLYPSTIYQLSVRITPRLCLRLKNKLSPISNLKMFRLH